MGQSGSSRSCRLTMRLPYLTSLLLVVSILPVTIAEPDVFGDYFDDGMKLVDISQDAALRSCLSDGKTADKTKAAYDECYGQGYDFDDLAKAGSDDDGLPDELEEKEGRFYKKMGWVSEDNVMDEAAIAADMEGLEDGIQDGFLSDVRTCVAWSGNFEERRKREAGMEVHGETQETQDREVVPGLMDTGRRALGWVRKLVRKVRSPGKEGPKKNKECNKGKDGKCKGRGNKKNRPKNGRRRNRPGRGRSGGRRSKKKAKKSGKRPQNGKNSGRGGRGGRRSKKEAKKSGKRPNNGKGAKGKDTSEETEKKRSRSNDSKGKGGKGKKDSLPEAVYNKLWCIDLAIEQAL